MVDPSSEVELHPGEPVLGNQVRHPEGEAMLLGMLTASGSMELPNLASTPRCLAEVAHVHTATVGGAEVRVRTKGCEVQTSRTSLYHHICQGLSYLLLVVLAWCLAFQTSCNAISSSTVSMRGSFVSGTHKEVREWKSALDSRPYDIGIRFDNELRVIELSSHAVSQGIALGDELTGIEGKAVKSKDDCKSALDQCGQAARRIRLSVKRQGGERVLDVAMISAFGPTEKSVMDAVSKENWAEAASLLESGREILLKTMVPTGYYSLLGNTCNLAEWPNGGPLSAKIIHVTYHGLSSVLDVSERSKGYYDENRPFVVGWIDPLAWNGYESYSRDVRARVDGLDAHYSAQPKVKPDSRSAEARAGTGFLVHPSGLVLTANHVVEGATSIEVTMDGGNMPIGIASNR